MLRTWTAASAALVSFVSMVLQLGIAPAADTADTASKPAMIRVFAAASATNAIRDIKVLFAEKSKAEIQTNFGSSGTLARQILNGADADIFLSADLKWADELAKKGFVAKRRELLGNRLVIVVPVDSKLKIEKLEDLTNPEITHVALGEPKSVPVGKYSKKALEKLGLWDKIAPKMAAANDVRNALMYVETGAAEAGIVYATDAAISKKVRVAAEIPESLTGPVLYPIALLKHGAETKAAEDFFDFLGSPEALKIFQKYGFTVVQDHR